MPAALRIPIQIALVLTLAFSSHAIAGEWMSDFQAAQREAQRLDRPLLLHFYATWCMPCRQMEQDVLHRAALTNQFGREVVGVKLDTQAHPDLVRQYNIESIPADVFLAPDGQVLGQMNGLKTADDYLRRVAAIEQQYSRLRQLHLVRSNSNQVPTQLSPNPQRPPLSDSASPDTESGGLRIKPRADGSILLGLKGFSPVTLYRDHRWVKGDPQFAWEHQGLTYFMTSEDELRQFQTEAERFAPRLLGCDPVMYYDQGRAVPGSPIFAAYSGGELYLFASAETRASFRDDPDRYTRHRQVLLLEELETVVR